VQFLVLRPVQVVIDLPPPVIWLSVLNAIACTAVPVLLVMMAIERIGPALTSQTGMLGPLSTIGMGIVLLDEPFTGWVAVGTLLCVAGIWTFTSAKR
jgi:drug/metabolite transporter (DMT)-like permease